MSAKKNLIISILHGYDYPFVEPFIKSLRETSFNGDLVIFVSEKVSKATKRVLKKRGTTLIEYHSAYPFIDNYKDYFNNIDPKITINNYRFILYLKYLADHAPEYQNVMLTDIRDVIFQDDPFKRVDNQSIYFFLEDASEVFRTSKLNYNWCVYANGVEVTNKIIDQNVSCAGIVIGEITRILDYLDYMYSRFINRPDLGWGLDQGIHNAYLYDTPKPLKQIILNTQPIVLTLGACENFSQAKNGDVTNPEGEPYDVIHQYDRFGELMVYFKAKYIGNRLTQITKKRLYAILP